jgi:hypothetical protein
MTEYYFSKFLKNAVRTTYYVLCVLHKCRKQWPHHVLLPYYMSVLCSAFIYLELGVVRLLMNLQRPKYYHNAFKTYAHPLGRTKLQD